MSTEILVSNGVPTDRVYKFNYGIKINRWFKWKMTKKSFFAFHYMFYIIIIITELFMLKSIYTLVLNYILKFDWPCNV